MGCGANGQSSGQTDPIKMERNNASPPHPPPKDKPEIKGKEEPKKAQEEKKEIKQLAPVPESTLPPIESLGKITNTPQVAHKEHDADIAFPSLESTVVNSIFDDTPKDQSKPYCLITSST